jgi:hypothetical protein
MGGNLGRRDRHHCAVHADLLKASRFAWAHGDENVNDDRVRLIIHNPAASQMMLAAFLWSRRGYECFPVRHDDSVGNTVRDVAALVEFPA